MYPFVHPMQPEYTPAHSDWLRPVKNIVTENMSMLAVVKREIESFRVVNMLTSSLLFFSTQGVGLKRNMANTPEIVTEVRIQPSVIQVSLSRIS